MGIIGFAVKVGLAGGAVYYINNQGVWSQDSQESVKTYNNIKTSINPYIDDIKAQIPIELPKIPETDNLWQMGRQYWNKGVQATFQHLSNSPQYIKEWTQNGLNSAMENEGIKSFVESFSAKEQPLKKGN
ncbi:unnamed protein product [Brassicogethes aeneus]|uniref:MICOS complex subunit MIC13 n=1 Tax=Brassicogethes aeneus TaxID=1431903 RepID=A0A9P0BC80_BRAAE|nr:unnamed protein product [Brassicogethes aeneus]